jgi:hypothetical protein
MASLLACGKPDPVPTSRDGGAGDAERAAVDSGTSTDAGADSGNCPLAPNVEDVSKCQPAGSDYQPRKNNSAGDGWAPCISDDNTYHRIQQTVSSIARVTAFEDIAAKLWEGGKPPSTQDFLDSRIIYAQDQGLDSRVQRREDVHYAAPSGGKKCSDPGAPDLFPDRCVGPKKLLPILNESFAAGSKGETPRAHAARIEAALLWFLYVSSLSEVESCAAKPADCDSAWAYYTGGTPRESPIALARYVKARGPETHDRAYDGVLAVRCWRNLDNETGTAQNLVQRNQARDQLDRAMLRGVALIVRQRLSDLACASGDVKDARFAFVRTLLPFLDRAARERDATKADVLKAQAQAASPDLVDVGAAITALDGLFPCP